MAASKASSDGPLMGSPLRQVWLFRRRFHSKVKSGPLAALMPLVTNLRSRCCQRPTLCKPVARAGPPRPRSVRVTSRLECSEWSSRILQAFGTSERLGLYVGIVDRLTLHTSPHAMRHSCPFKGFSIEFQGRYSLSWGCPDINEKPCEDVCGAASNERRNPSARAVIVAGLMAP